MESPDDSSTMPPHNISPEGPASNCVPSIFQCMPCSWEARNIIPYSVNICLKRMIFEEIVLRGTLPLKLK